MYTVPHTNHHDQADKKNAVLRIKNCVQFAAINSPNEESEFHEDVNSAHLELEVNSIILSLDTDSLIFPGLLKSGLAH